MHLLLGKFANWWTNLYNATIGTMDYESRHRVGGGAVLLAVLLFAWSMNGSKKSQVINSWFMFWVSIIILIIAILMLVY